MSRRPAAGPRAAAYTLMEVMVATALFVVTSGVFFTLFSLSPTLSVKNISLNDSNAATQTTFDKVLTTMKNSLLMDCATFNPTAQTFTAAGIVTMTAAPLRTMERTFRAPLTGERSLTCLLLDGKLLPLMPPHEAKITGSGEALTLVWPDERASAKFRGANAKEAAPLAGDDWNKLTPTATDGWARASAAGVAPGVENLTPARAELDVIMVNHWRAGLLSQDYKLGGQSFSHLLLLCRCADGFVFAVTLDVPGADVIECRRTLLGMIGGPILIREDEMGS